jgi:hypothetical protein
VLRKEGGGLPWPPEHEIVQNEVEPVVMKQIQLSVTIILLQKDILWNILH